MSRLLASASIAAMAIGTVGTAQAADLFVGAAPIVPQELTKQRTISGSVSLYGSWSDLETASPSNDSDFDYNPWSIGGDAKVDIPFSDVFSLQLDQLGEAMFTDDGSTSEQYHGGYLAGAHLTYREMDRYLFGAFGGGGVVHFGSTSDDAYTQWLAGVEGQLYFGNTTLFGQVGYSDNKSQETSSDANLINNAWFLRGVARQYLNSGDTKLEGEIGYIDGVNDNDVSGSVTDDMYAVWWGAEIEHAVFSFGDDGFVSLFGRYEGYYYNEDGGGGTDETTNHVVKLGLKMDLNNANPLMRERYGPAVDLPNMNRINGHSRSVD